MVKIGFRFGLGIAIFNMPESPVLKVIVQAAAGAVNTIYPKELYCRGWSCPLWVHMNGKRNLVREETKFIWDINAKASARTPSDIPPKVPFHLP